MIKVLLADDHKIIIDGIKSIIKQESGIEIVGEASNGEEVLALLKEKAVDLVVLDIEMPIKNGVETTKEIRKHYPNVQVLILSMYNKKSFILQLMKIGAAGYILKNKSKEELIGAIYNIYSGKSHYGIEILNQVTRLGINTPELDVQLSEREVEILCHIAEGETTREIAAKLNISKATVNTHRRNLLQKLEVPNDKHLVRYAIKEKLVEL